MGEKKDSFRFTVQFNAGAPSHQQVAAILNEQGRRKAQFLVNAVTHYMNYELPGNTGGRGCAKDRPANSGATGS